MIYQSHFGPLPEPPPLNASDFLFNPPGIPAHPPDQILHIDAITGFQRTRAEFTARVNALAREFCTPTSEGGMGLVDFKNVMVGIYSDNSLDMIVLIHALLRSAIPFALLSSHSTPFELIHLLTKSSSTHLFIESSRLPITKKVLKDPKVNRILKSNNVYFIEEDGGERLSVESMAKSGLKKVARLTGGVADGGFKARPVGKDTLAYLVFSSGTSGLPKAVMISHGNIIFAFMQGLSVQQELFKFKPPPPDLPQVRVLGFLPMYHTYGLHTYVFRAIVGGICTVLMPRWDVNLAIELIPKYRVTALALIPSIIHTLLTHPSFSPDATLSKKPDLSSVTALGSGAAYLPPSMASSFASLFPNVPKEEKGMKIPSGYGMSEHTLTATAVAVAPGMCKGKVRRVVPEGSVGILLSGMEARIVIEEPLSPTSGVERDGETKFRDAELGEVGELWLRGHNVALGYYKDEKATKATFGLSTGDQFGGGWLRTGDRFSIDGEGFLYFSDRTKDTLKVSGMQVSPSELESFLLSPSSSSSSVATLITDVAVAGVSTTHSSRTKDELVPRAWVVPSMAGRALGERELERRVENAVKQGLSKYKWLRGGVEIVDEIPKNATGKVLKRILVEKYNLRSKGFFSRLKAKL